MSPKRKPIVWPHLVRYGTAADQKYLLGEFLDTYDTLVLNATMVAHMPSALASFVVQRARNKPYFIDPQTHAFQHDVSNLESGSNSREGKIKRSVQRLLDAYGTPVLEIVGGSRQPLLPSDLHDSRLLRGFCRRVLSFQANALREQAEDSDAAKYYKYLKRKKKLGQTHFGPSLLVAPYFYLSANTFSEWLKVNLACARMSRKIVKDERLALQVTLSKDVLTNERLSRALIDGYKEIDRPDVILVWIDSLSEHEADEAQLLGLRRLLAGLGEIAPVVNLYGGFFSVALCRCGLVPNLIGVTHGPEYGEARGVVPVGGGLPTAKYYYPGLHKRLPFRDALRAVRAVRGMKSPEAFHSEVCGCDECLRVITEDPNVDFREYGRSKPISYKRGGATIVREYPLTETKDHSVRHYMWCKADEFSRELSIEGVASELKRAGRLLSRVLGPSVAHCHTWVQSLQE
ncbi:MAG: hypothetical protein HQ559_02595 [Lentisphaerae bacterium]|nr:hypothetical protein [Lentisphaerota bacterium]